MNDFKIRLDDKGMKTVAFYAASLAEGREAAMTVDDLIRFETLERIWSRLRNQFAPGRDKYTVQLNASEVKVLRGCVLPTMLMSGDVTVVAMADALEERLFNQLQNRLNILNSFRYGC